MAETVVATGQRIFPANNGPGGTVLAADAEKFQRYGFQEADFVALGLGLSTSGSSLSVTLAAGYLFIDGRQVLDGATPYTFTLPANETRYIMVDRAGRVFHRDTNNPVVGTDLLLWTAVTNATGVTSTTENRRLNAFRELGLNDNEFLYLSSNRAKFLRFDTALGVLRLTGVAFQPDSITGLPAATAGSEPIIKTTFDAHTGAFGLSGHIPAGGITDTHVSASAAIADTKLAASYIKADGTRAFTGNQSLATFRLTNVGDPTGAQDAATKAYVDSFVQGLDTKKSVRVATTAAGTLASSFENGDTVDGVVLATGNRILLKNQAAGAENGIYTVNASGAPTRATDADSDAEVTAGLFIFVEEGTVNADSGWVLTNDGAIVVGTTALTFTQFSGAGQITAGAGLSKTGNTLDVVVDGSTLEIAGDAVQVKASGITATQLAASVAGNGLAGGAGTALSVAVDGSSLEISADALRVKAAGVTEAMFATAVASAPTASTLVKRDANGRAQFADPSASGDAATKNYVDANAMAKSAPSGILAMEHDPGNVAYGSGITVIKSIDVGANAQIIPIYGTVGQVQSPASGKLAIRAVFHDGGTFDLLATVSQGSGATKTLSSQSGGMLAVGDVDAAGLLVPARHSKTIQKIEYYCDLSGAATTDFAAGKLYGFVVPRGTGAVPS